MLWHQFVERPGTERIPEKQSVFANGIWRYSLFTATQFLRWVRVGSKRSVLKSLGFLNFCELFKFVARKYALFAVWEWLH